MKVIAYVQPRRTIGRVTGVGKFIAGAPFALRDCGHDVQLLSASDEWTDESRLAQLPHRVLPYRRRFLEWGGTLVGWPRVHENADWLWCTAESFVAVRGTRLAVTAHTSDWLEPDLPWAREWRYRKLRARWRLYYRIIRKAKVRVLCVSEFLRRRLIEKVGLANDQVFVVGHGVDDEFFDPPPYDLSQAIPAFEQYILVTGGLSIYKGGDRIELLARSLPDVRFVVVGELAGLMGSAIPNIYRCGYRDVSLGLPALYANAAAVLVLSRYETFGLPAAEAMAIGVPLIVSNAGALPEVVGDAGIIVDGDDIDGIAGIIRDLVRDEAARAQHGLNNRKRAQTFRWERTGQRIADALQM